MTLNSKQLSYCEIKTSGFIVMVSALYLVSWRMQTVELTANYVHMLLGKEMTT